MRVVEMLILHVQNQEKNQIADLKAYNEKLLNGDIEKHNKIVELESLLTKAVKLLKRCHDDYVYLPPLRTDIEEFLEEV